MGDGHRSRRWRRAGGEGDPRFVVGGHRAVGARRRAELAERQSGLDHGHRAGLLPDRGRVRRWVAGIDRNVCRAGMEHAEDRHVEINGVARDMHANPVAGPDPQPPEPAGERPGGIEQLGVGQLPVVGVDRQAVRRARHRLTNEIEQGAHPRDGHDVRLAVDRDHSDRVWRLAAWPRSSVR